jgi:DNA-binding protein H-NS
MAASLNRPGESMAKSLKQIEQQIAKLQREAEAIKMKEVAGVIERMKTAIAHYGLKPSDLFEAKSPAAGSNGKSVPRKVSAGQAPKKKQTVPVKYRDEHGNTWTSRGSQPRWLVAALQSGRQLEEFAVKPH